MFHKMQPEWSQSGSRSFFTLRSAVIKVENDIALYSHPLKLEKWGQTLPALNDSNARFLEQKQERTMPQFQPRPMVVIRNQLLAFLVLHLLGSCVPMSSTQHSLAAVDSGRSSVTLTVQVQTSQINRFNLNPPAR